jgi:hypothetical protein
MKQTILYLLLFCISTQLCFAQKETLDLTTYSVPKGWKKQVQQNVVQFTKEDKASGAYCVMTLYKSVEATNDAKKNFAATWETVIKDLVTVTGPPQMQAPNKENEWELQTGSAAFEKDGSKGVVILATVSGYQRMINIVVVTNSGIYEKAITAFTETMNFKKPAAATVKKNIPVNKTVTPENSTLSNNTSSAKPNPTGFAFTTTNWDDGWTSVEKEDWVEVTKGNIRVLLHYKHPQADAYNSDVMAGEKNAWNILVAPRYSSAVNMNFKPHYSWQTIEFADADMTETASGKQVYVVFFKKHYSSGSGIHIEFICPNRQTFENQFGRYNAEESWDKVEKMADYNRFALAATDLNGTWTNNFSGMTQYVNAYTGASAGADTHASSQKFVFGAGNTYKWDIGVASGFVGSIKFQTAKSNGKFTLLNAWQVRFSDMEGKPKTYDAYFSCSKGTRVLWFSDVTYPGYTAFGKKE